MVANFVSTGYGWLQSLDGSELAHASGKKSSCQVAHIDHLAVIALITTLTVRQCEGCELDLGLAR
jgi:hypothetical protein